MSRGSPWTLVLVVMALVAVLLVFAMAKRAEKSQLETARFAMLVNRMRALDNALADFEVDFGSRFDASDERGRVASERTNEVLSARNKLAVTRLAADVDAHTRVVDSMKMLRTNYTELEALANKFHDEDRELLMRFARVMKGRHNEIISYLADDGLKDVVNGVLPETFEVAPRLRSMGVQISDQESAAIDALNASDIQQGMTLKESLFLRLKSLPSVMTRAAALVAARPVQEDRLQRLLASLRETNAAALADLQNRVLANQSANTALAAIAGSVANRAAAVQHNSASVLANLQTSYAGLSAVQGGRLTTAQAAEEANAAAEAAAAQQANSTASQSTANADAAAAAAGAAATAASEAAVQQVLADARAAAAVASAARTRARLDKIEAMKLLTVPEWDAAKPQPGMRERLSSEAHTDRAAMFSIYRISTAYDGPIFTLSSVGGYPQTRDFYSTDAGLVTTGRGGAGMRVDEWCGGEPVLVDKWYDQSGRGHHAWASTTFRPSLTLKGATAINVRFDDNQYLALPPNAVPSGSMKYTVSAKHGGVSASHGGTPDALILYVNGNEFGVSESQYLNYWTADAPQNASRGGVATPGNVVTFQYDGLRRRTYVNGTLKRTYTPSSNVKPYGSPVSPRIGNLQRTGAITLITLNRLYIFNDIIGDSDRGLLESSP
jgi:hypothetical protein